LSGRGNWDKETTNSSLGTFSGAHRGGGGSKCFLKKLGKFPLEKGGGIASGRQGDGRPWAHSQQICFFASSFCSASNRNSFTLFARERGFTAIGVLLVILVRKFKLMGMMKLCNATTLEKLHAGNIALMRYFSLVGK
jgi:hypothetical protein